MDRNIANLFAECERDRFALHTRYLNEQMVRVLKAIGYDVGFCRGEGQYLYDREGIRYLDLLSGFGVFAVGRNHPTLREALKSACAVSRQSIFREFWIGGCRGGYQVRARGHRSPRHHLL